ncbi:MAG: hypothetical protein ABID87_07585 [Chloroflexota bacterium]
MTDDKVKELEAKLAELRSRWPSHSAPVSMWMDLEELEEALAKAKKEAAAK